MIFNDKRENFATSSGSNSWSFATLYQRAVGSTPARPTKFFNNFRILPLDSVNVVPSLGAKGDRVLAGLEDEAREAKKGL
jgi:hypothetical protein